jgi:hypothetical protein
VVKRAILFVGLAACSWTEFDDIKDTTWVTSTEKPSNDSSNWALAIQRGQAEGVGGRLAVMGANQSLYTELVVDASGSVKDANVDLQLNSQFGVGNLDPQPILIADPADNSNDIALVTPSGATSIAVLKGTAGQLTLHQVFGPITVDAATWMVPSAPAMQVSQTLVAEMDKVYGTFFAGPPNPQPSCKLHDETNAAVMIRALGAIPRMQGDGLSNVLVWSSTGKLLRYPPDVFNGATGTLAGACTTGVAAGMNAVTTTPFMPGKGSQILTFEADGGRFAVLQGHTDSGQGYLALYDVQAMALVGSARSDLGLKQAALMELDGKRYVVAGFPGAIVDGTSGAGQVLVFEVSTTAGIGGAPVLTLSDAEPEGNQQFGRSVAVMPFGGKPLIVVAADNEIFTYFRTQLYAETRPGR